MRPVALLGPQLYGVAYSSRRAAERTRAVQRARGVQLGGLVKLWADAHEPRPIQ